MAKSVKFIIDTIGSERDRNGNCYYICTVTRTSDKSKSTQFIADCDNSGKQLVRKMFGLDHSEVYAILRTVPIRQFNGIQQAVSLYQHSVTKTMLSRGADK